MAKIKYQGRKGNRVTAGQIERKKRLLKDKKKINESMVDTARGKRPTDETKKITDEIKNRQAVGTGKGKSKNTGTVLTSRGSRPAKPSKKVAEAMKPLAEAAKNKTLVGGTKPTGTMAKLLEAMSQSDKKKKKKKSSGLRAVRRMMSSRYQR
jgi:hypothetical protein